MKRPKSKRRQASPIKMPKGTNHKPVLRRKKKFKLTSIFKRNRYSRSNHINSKYIVLPLLILSLAGLIFLAIKYIDFVRGDSGEEVEVGEVIGLEGVPEYPKSEFIFANSLEDSIVKEFLSTGNSAYRLLESSSIEKINTYYQKLLPDLGWQLVAEVPLGTEDKKYGQYWVKEGKGLRIYSKFKDIWYESVTEEEAKTALANKVKEEIEREMLMASSEKQDLLPDYPWRIQIPKEYIIKYSATGLKDFRAVSFQKLGSNDIVQIYPVARLGSKELDYMLEDYCSEKSTKDFKYSVMNTVPVSFREYLALRGTVKYPTGQLDVVVIPNSFNATVYVLSSTKQNDPLLEYVLENIKPMGSEN